MSFTRGNFYAAFGFRSTTMPPVLDATGGGPQALTSGEAVDWTLAAPLVAAGACLLCVAWLAAAAAIYRRHRRRDANEGGAAARTAADAPRRKEEGGDGRPLEIRTDRI